MHPLHLRDRENLKENDHDQSSLHTEGPLSEKDEVKQAEANTNSAQTHDAGDLKKLRDGTTHPVKDSGSQIGSISKDD